MKRYLCTNAMILERNKVYDSGIICNTKIINWWLAFAIRDHFSVLLAVSVSEHLLISASVHYPNTLMTFGCSNLCECLFPFILPLFCEYWNYSVYNGIISLYSPLYNVMFSISA